MATSGVQKSGCILVANPTFTPNGGQEFIIPVKLGEEFEAILPSQMLENSMDVSLNYTAMKLTQKLPELTLRVLLSGDEGLPALADLTEETTNSPLTGVLKLPVNLIGKSSDSIQYAVFQDVKTTNPYVALSGNKEIYEAKFIFGQNNVREILRFYRDLSRE